MSFVDLEFGQNLVIHYHKNLALYEQSKMSTNLSSLISGNIKHLIRLPYSFVSITGTDAEKFLQGQLTCDLASIIEQTVQFGTINSPKGRIYGFSR